ncbi:unnamed protein product [Ilex paraguariensis]|uniref:Uncharacterized protein n=1 Tax=Ilex paraguariensis TaxID=185542 RepID=A0ABC8UA37_9AQUA
MAASAPVESHSTVTVTKTVSVYPKALHPPNLLRLSNLDRQCPLLMYLVFFYKPSHGFRDLSIDAISSRLRNGLEETLSVWYPAAGRLSLNPSDGKLDLWCNNGGVILVEGATHVKMSELGDLSLHHEFSENLVFKPVFNGNITEMPLVVAQVTKFGCGGYSIGIGTSHSLFDAPAAYDFLSAWASQSNMRGNEGSEPHVKPVHERGRLLMGDYQSQKEININPGRPAKRVAAIDHLYQLIKKVTPQNHENYVLRTFHLSGAVIENLKRKVFVEKRGSFSFSSFEVVSAHLWKTRTKALRIDHEQMVCLQFAVDIRNKMVPPLPKHFSGNAYVLASVALTAGELEEQSHHAIVEKIKEAKNSVTDDYVIAYNKALQGPPATLPPLKELTMVSDWTRVPFHKVDFLGEEAAYASPLASPIPQVAYLMQNPVENRGVDVRIGLHPDIIDVFSHYFICF